MASLGLGIIQGGMMANQLMQQDEDLSRLKAGRKLFDAQLKEQTAAAELLNDMNTKARAAKASILKNQEGVMLGDPTATANILRDTIYKGQDVKVTTDPSTREVVIISKDGKELGRQAPLSGVQGVAKLMQLGNNIDQVYANNVTAEQTAAQRAYEMTKMREEKGFDYKKAVDVAGLGAQATLGAASIGANADVAAANIRANADTTKATLDADAKVRAALFGNIENIDQAMWNRSVSLTTGQPVGIDPVSKAPVYPQMTPEQNAQAVNYFNAMNNQVAVTGPKTTPQYAYNQGVLFGTTPSAEGTNTLFNTLLADPTQWSVGMPQFNAGFSPAQSPQNNFGVNWGQTYSDQAMRNLQVEQAAAAQNADAMQARRLEQARRYGF